MHSSSASFGNVWCRPRNRLRRLYVYHYWLVSVAVSLSFSLTSLCTFTMCHNEQRPPQPDAWVCPGLDCFAFRNQISSLRFPFSLSLALLSLLSPSPSLATLSQIAIKTDSWRSPLARLLDCPFGVGNTVRRALSHHWGIIVFARRQRTLCSKVRVEKEQRYKCEKRYLF